MKETALTRRDETMPDLPPPAPRTDDIPDPSEALRPTGDPDPFAIPDKRRSWKRKYTWLAWLMVVLGPVTAGVSFVAGVVLAMIGLARRPKSIFAWSGLLAQVVPLSIFVYMMLVWGPFPSPPQPLDVWRHRAVVGGPWTRYAPQHLWYAETQNPFFGDVEARLRYRSFGRDTFDINRVREFAETQGLVVYRQDRITADRADRMHSTLMGYMPKSEISADVLREDLTMLQKLSFPLTASAHRMITMMYKMGGDVEFLVFEPQPLGDGTRRETFIAVRADGRRMVVFNAIREDE